MATIYQKRVAARRKTADITRLADQYKRNVESLTGEQEKAFGQYQAQTKEKMAPYEAAVAQYGEAFKTYESQAAAYRQKLDQYNATLADIAANPTETIVPTSTRAVTRGRTTTYYGTIDGKEYSFGEMLNMGWEPEYQKQVVKVGKTYDQRMTGIASVTRDRAVPTFTERAPTAPTAPTAPKIGEFDTTQFDARRGQLETEFNRELGERRGARMAAVSRKTSRPLMQGRS